LDYEDGMNTYFATGSWPTRMVIHIEHWQSMLDHIRDCLPEEACGLVGGRIQGETAHSEVVIPIVNELHSPVRFRMEPNEQIQAFYVLEKMQLDLIAIFHSHPAGPPAPSATDLTEFAYPGTLTLIWSPRAETLEWQLRGFRIESGQAVEIPFVTIPPGSQPVTG
jgi:[CysO sulfur-carrier protein]-S-L-cysteine hydrolase